MTQYYSLDMKILFLMENYRTQLFKNKSLSYYYKYEISHITLSPMGVGGYKGNMVQKKYFLNEVISKQNLITSSINLLFQSYKFSKHSSNLSSDGTAVEVRFSNEVFFVSRISQLNVVISDHSFASL